MLTDGETGRKHAFRIVIVLLVVLINRFLQKTSLKCILPRGKMENNQLLFKLNNPYKYTLTDCMWCYIVISSVLKTDVGKFLLKTNGPNSVSKSRCGQNTHQLLAQIRVSKSASDWGTKSTNRIKPSHKSRSKTNKHQHGAKTERRDWTRAFHQTSEGEQTKKNAETP